LAEDNNFQDRDENNVGYVIPSKAFDNFDDFINTLKIPYFDDDLDPYTIEVVDGDKTVCFDDNKFLKVYPITIIFLFLELIYINVCC
jgi:hypothetical protein